MMDRNINTNIDGFIAEYVRKAQITDGKRTQFKSNSDQPRLILPLKWALLPLLPVTRARIPVFVISVI
jgi:hypothetical protein